MDTQKRKIAVAIGNADKSALETIYKALQEHQVLDHVQVTFFPAGTEGLEEALIAASSGFDAMIALPVAGIDIPKFWREKWAALKDTLQISTYGDFPYITLITEPTNDVGFLPDMEKNVMRIEKFSEALKSMFRLPLPRLAVMSTSKNSDGKSSKEDKEILIPAIQKAFEKLIPVFGTFSSEVFFASESFLRFDGFCFVNREQVDAMIAKYAGINILFEAEAPIVLATPITDVTDMEEIFRETLYKVNDVLRYQKEYAELSKNPLKFELERKNNEFQAF
ncbi:MAG: 4-hydroxythreonine-4-phosphate dehydrogenase PdxA [Bacteroidales bacterium]|nr:4-hydroxythreonine-4-phosphate dehydrogenase PdxA [Bacteroidales bacterium]